MIFVTVGTHEQPFDRLVGYIDQMKEKQVITEEVVVQTGFCTYVPRNCVWKNMFSYEDMIKNMERARIIITHGGPSSFITALQLGKIPIVVPRQRRYHEHVNDHQLQFAKEVAERNGNLVVVEDIKQLDNLILKYNDIIQSMPVEIKSNNSSFNVKLEKIVQGMSVI